MESEANIDDEMRARRDDERAVQRFRWEILLPFSPIKPSGHQAERRFPAVHAGWMSISTYHWLNSLIFKAQRQPLQLGDLWRVHPRNRTDWAGSVVMDEWQSRTEKKGVDASKVSVSTCLLQGLKWRIALCLLLMTLYSGLSFSGQAIFVFELLNFAQKPADADVNITEGILLVVGVFLNEIVRTMVFAAHWHNTIHIGLRFRSAIGYIVYQKIMKLRNLANMTVGQLVNLCVNDGERLYTVGMTCAFTIQAPVMTIAVVAYTVYLIGWPAVVGQIAFWIFFVLMTLVGRAQALYRRRAIDITDVRVRTMNEILTFVKLIKMYAWELPFSRYVANVRSQEKIELRKSAYLQGISSSCTLVIPSLATAITLAAQTLSGGDVTVPKAFAILSAFGSMRHCLGTLPFFVRAFSEARVAIPRLKELLLLPERKPVSNEVRDPQHAVELYNASLAWDTVEAPKDKVKKTKIKTPSSPSQRETHSGNGYVNFGKQEANGVAVTCQKGDAGCELSDGVPDCLVNVSLMVKKGELIGVCGAFGSGKSSLLSALLGGLNIRGGSVALNGSVAYVSQQAWIVNASVRDNILFGMHYEQSRYKRVLAASALQQDLEILPDGDLTEIGERGINLSGGQKQRVSLARALYAERDVYLLDDPLSAVDAHVGSHIFNELIKKELSGKTVILVTHQLQYLPMCDRVVMMAGGCVAEEGTYTDLLAAQMKFYQLIQQHHAESQESNAEAEIVGHSEAVASEGDLVALQENVQSLCDEDDDAESLADEEEDCLNESSQSTPAVLVKAEDRRRGSISWSTYWAFIRACGGLPYLIALLLLTMSAAGAQAAADYWLSYWLRQGDGSSSSQDTTNTTLAPALNSTMPLDSDSGSIADNPRLEFYVGIYFVLAFALIITSITRSVFAMHILLRGCSRLHDIVFRKVFRAPMSFFESTPTGQIINRFSKDMDELDALMPFVLGIVVRNWMTLLLLVVFASAIYPVLFAVLLVIVIIFFAVYRVYTLYVREIKRLDGITRSPYISHLTATVQGLSSVHAYGKEEEYRQKFCRLLDSNTVCFQAFHMSGRWLATRLDILSAVMVGATALALVLSRDSTNVALGAIALTYVVQLGANLQFTVRMTSELEARFTSVERLNHYATALDEEAPEHIEETMPPASWPSQGQLEFSDVSMRYREGTPLVLHSVSFRIEPEEKIGVIGRTGAGKSSLAVCLLRLVEIESGSISIDGVSIHGLGLSDLRSRLSVIPQDPVLFVGTVRYNLDPFNNHSEEEIEQALRQTHLQDTIDALPDGLQTEVLENGENFSVGERQLMCMARALLRHSKVLILDEATASIDSETDALIQRTIRECFADCTLLTIAHRLNTVLDSDRLLVMDEGRVVEFDTPANLLANPQSVMSQMMASSGSKKQTRRKREQRGGPRRSRPVAP